MLSTLPDSDRPRRILWLLNHKTLMKVEVPVMLSLGYEVYVPKLIPTIGFRSGGVDFSYDQHLTIPASEIELLNSFNFYSDVWTDEIVSILNTRFAIAFIRPYTDTKFSQCLRLFEGHVALRGFGNHNKECYIRTLWRYGGPGAIEAVESRGSRFSLAAGYRQLAEAEPSFLARRTVHLPIGMPVEFNQHSGTWTGKRRCVLTIMPDIKERGDTSVPYEEFKEYLGHLPHVIAGAQTVPVNDPNVTGFVTDQKMISLFSECAAYFASSRNHRHILYSPIEAAIIGQPVVCHRDSLLGQLIGPRSQGCVASLTEAADVLGRILDGEPGLAESIIAEQQDLIDGFSVETCRRIFAQTLPRMADTAFADIGPTRPTIPASELLSMLPEEIGEPAEQKDWLDFSAPLWPRSIQGIFGLGVAESWGRWTEYEHVMIAFSQPLPHRTCLCLFVGADPGSRHRPITVKAGMASATFEVTKAPWAPNVVPINLEPGDGVHLIEFIVPNPTPSQGGRRIGLGFCRMRILDMDLPENQELLAEADLIPVDGVGDATFDTEINLGSEEWPAIIAGYSGLDGAEGWGRWSDGDLVRLKFSRPLPRRMRLLLSAGAEEGNLNRPIEVWAGGSTATFELMNVPWNPQTVQIELEPSEGAQRIEFRVPNPVQGERRIGLGFCRMRILDMDLPVNRELMAESGLILVDGVGDATFDTEINFGLNEWPAIVAGYSGLDGTEGWGRWSDGDTVRLKFSRPLPRRMRLLLSAGAEEGNLNRPIEVWAGGSTATFELMNVPWNPQTIRVELEPTEGSKMIEFRVPNPTQNGRRIGLGICWIRVLDMDLPESQELVAGMGLTPVNGVGIATFDTEINLSLEEWPAIVAGYSGLVHPDEWGRWIEGDLARLKFSRPLPSHLRIIIGGGANEGYTNLPVIVSSGGARTSVSFANPPWRPEVVQADLIVADGTHMLDIIVPTPSTGDSVRRIGIGVGTIRILDLSALANSTN